MPFQFSLQAVLNLRQSVEYQQELRLRAANQQLSAMRHLIDVIEQRIGQLENLSHSAINAGLSASEMHFNLVVKSRLESQRQEAGRELLRLQNLRDAQQRIFQQARRERETFETLRDQQLREYIRAASRREQRYADDVFLLRQVFRRHS
ncbi:MAG TPA: flagellar export protein FliJ [Candidatus Sulfotelmatobacter sp.]|nr:flagellar export protein FliJ [Candidatus Sulfotelmatobacter sp.]